VDSVIGGSGSQPGLLREHHILPFSEMG
jgi:hypothetical protein